MPRQHAGAAQREEPSILHGRCRLGGLSAFITSSPFLAHQKLLAERRGLPNCLAFLEMGTIPCGCQVRNLLDPVPSQHFDAVIIDVVRNLEYRGALIALRSRRSGLNHETLIALGGTVCLNSRRIGCPNCSGRTGNKGTDDETGGARPCGPRRRHRRSGTGRGGAVTGGDHQAAG